MNKHYIMLLSINDASDSALWLMLLMLGLVFLLFITIAGLIVIAIFKGIDRMGKEN